MAYDLLIKNGSVVFPNVGVQKADIAVADGKIAALLATGAAVEAKEVVDAAGLYVFPGGIDPHMHIGIYNPLEYDFTAETGAGAIGGLTAIVNYYRGPKSYNEYAPELIACGEKNSLLDFTFSFGVLTQRHLNELVEIYEKYGITSYKFYRNYQDKIGSIFGVDDPLTLDAADMMDILKLFKETSDKLVLCVHCEDMDLQRSHVKKVAAEKEDSLAYFSKTSPDYCETASLMPALYLNDLVKGNLYIVHLSSGSSVQVLRDMDYLLEGVTIETTPHYLALNENSPCGLLAKVNPPIHTPEDAEALWEGIRDGYITAMGSDNCPSSLEKKYSKGTSVDATLPGFPGAGMILPILLSEGYHKRGIPLETLANITAASVAKALKIEGKGDIKVGYDADFAIVDLEKEQICKPEIFGASDYSVYDGMAIKGWPVYTYCRGRLIQKDGKIVAEPGQAKFLRR